MGILTDNAEEMLKHIYETEIDFRSIYENGINLHSMKEIRAIAMEKEEPKEIKGTGLTNFCKLGSMSTCGVVSGKKWKDHITCKYAVKAGYSDRCTDFRFDEYCTCLKAQLAAEELAGVQPQMYMA